MSQHEVRRYSYKGPVYEFDRIIAHRWTAETSAPSKEKALSNIAFRFKQDNNKIKTAKITLDPSKLVVIE